MIELRRYNHDTGEVDVIGEYDFWDVAVQCLKYRLNDLEYDGFRITEVGPKSFVAYMYDVRFKYYLKYVG